MDRLEVGGELPSRLLWARPVSLGVFWGKGLCWDYTFINEAGEEGARHQCRLPNSIVKLVYIFVLVNSSCKVNFAVTDTLPCY